MHLARPPRLSLDTGFFPGRALRSAAQALIRGFKGWGAEKAGEGDEGEGITDGVSFGAWI